MMSDKLLLNNKRGRFEFQTRLLSQVVKEDQEEEEDYITIRCVRHANTEIQIVLVSNTNYPDIIQQVNTKLTGERFILDDSVFMAKDGETIAETHIGKLPLKKYSVLMYIMDDLVKENMIPAIPTGITNEENTIPSILSGITNEGNPIPAIPSVTISNIINENFPHANQIDESVNSANSGNIEEDLIYHDDKSDNGLHLTDPSQKSIDRLSLKRREIELSL